MVKWVSMALDCGDKKCVPHAASLVSIPGILVENAITTGKRRGKRPQVQNSIKSVAFTKELFWGILCLPFPLSAPSLNKWVTGQ